MKRLAPLLLGTLLVLALLAPRSAAEDQPAAPRAEAPKFELTTYYFCLLTRGPKAGTGTPEEAAEFQRGHMANMQRLAAAGKLLVAGPFADGGDWRGIFILKCASLDEAKALVATDPAVAAGRLVADVRPWMTAKGYIRDPEFPMAP